MHARRLPSLPEDPSSPVKGMYPLLDLITELGSNGLGNRRFLNYWSLRTQNL